MYILIGVVGGLILLSLLISFIIFRMAFYSNKEKHIKLFDKLEGELDTDKKYRRELVERMNSLPYEDVYVKSHDGLTLHGKLYRTTENAPLSIQFHGYKSISVRDLAGGGKEALALGHNLLLVDQRAHGDSEGKVITFGIKERFDVLAWVNYGMQIFGSDVKIILLGISMGAGTILMASELDLPKNVVGICADCPFSSPIEIIKKVARRMKMPATALSPLIKLAARLFGGFNLTAASAKEAVKNSKTPILLIHGEGDNFVPVYMSDEIYSSNKNIEYIKFPEATHGMSYIKDTETYVMHFKKFINKSLGVKEKTDENQ